MNIFIDRKEELLFLDEQYGRSFEARNLRRMMQFAEQFSDSEWLVQATDKSGFYGKNGFKENDNVFLTIPCKLFSQDLF